MEPVDSMYAMELWDNQTLLDMWWRLTIRQRTAQEKRGRIELLLRQRMEADGAAIIPHPHIDCKLESSHTGYDITQMPALRELLPPEVIATGYTPAHDEVIHVPDKWDARQVRTWGKYGTEVQEAIARAELPRQIKLVIKERKEK